MTFSKILPAPGSLINSAGILDPSGAPAPGFSGVNFKSNYSVSLNRSRSNRGLPIDDNKHFWSFTINYHTMTMEEYTSIENFLHGHNTRRNPFYVSLPNYSVPKNSFFANYVDSNIIYTSGTGYAGDNRVTIVAPEGLEPGCYINFIDDDDALHKSTYKVSRVESPSLYSGDPPAAGTLRLTIFPPLQRDFSGNVQVRFINPLFRVLQTNDVEPNFDKNNNVTTNIVVEEILP